MPGARYSRRSDEVGETNIERAASFIYGRDVIDGHAEARAQHLLHIPVGLPEAERQEREDAALYVRRLANRHRCGGLCGRPEHARDAADILPALEVLGLL